MALAKKLPKNPSGDFDVKYFTPADFAGYTALLVEPLSIEEDIQTNFGLKDGLHFRLTAWPNKAAFDGEPEFYEDMRVTSAALVRNMREACGTGDEFPVTLGKVPTSKGNPAWVWEEIKDQEILALIEEFLEDEEP